MNTSSRRDHESILPTLLVASKYSKQKSLYLFGFHVTVECPLCQISRIDLVSSKVYTTNLFFACLIRYFDIVLNPIWKRHYFILQYFLNKYRFYKCNTSVSVSENVNIMLRTDWLCLNEQDMFTIWSLL